MQNELLLATDEDREGEAISWHLIELLKPKVPVKRMVFHEITKTAIADALQSTRSIDENLVQAQETRRILDRLVGYPLSNLVSKKIKRGLSAGRVQSVAVRLIVDRERERRSFHTGTYWDVKAQLEAANTPFEAQLETIDNTRIATGKDFDENTGQIPSTKNVILVDEKMARTIEQNLQNEAWQVTDYSEKPATSSPKPPFTTSTLQQEASRKLRMGARDTMRVAQGLYERGFITYMRTDSTHLSQQAIDAARAAARELYGANFVPTSPRVYKASAKGAQEAHEAIRPSGDAFVHPSKSGLAGRELKLYELIWMRTVACQMADARRTRIRIDLTANHNNVNYGFRATGNRIDFPGFMRAYVEGADCPEAALESKETLLPSLATGSDVNCTSLQAIGHETKPPARYTEATLVKALEERGVGRPSTYASIMDRITSDERYARVDQRMLIPTLLAFAVTSLLEKHFPELVDLEFTARLEGDLDKIAQGEETKSNYLDEFYSKDGAFAQQLRLHEKLINPENARKVELDEIDATVRVGRFGPYAELEIDGEKKTIDIPSTVAPAELTREVLEAALRKREEGPRVLGNHPSGEPILLLEGPFGPYVQLGEVQSYSSKKPKRCSIPKGQDPEELTLEKAIALLDLPRTLGEHPDDNALVQVGLGRYGPYVKHGREFRSLPNSEALFTFTLEEGLALLKEPKGRKKGFTLLRELGAHPKTGEVINIYEGRYGPFLKAEGKNVSIPRGTAPEKLTMDMAVELIEAKKASPKRRSTRGKAKTTKKSPAKKSTAKKKTATKKKAPAKKKKEA